MPTQSTRQLISLDTVLLGWGASEYFTLKGQFMSSIGIDPEMPKDDSTTRPSGLIRPTAMANIANNLTGACMWLIGDNKDALTYGYQTDGKVFTLDSAYAQSYLNGGTALTASSANGAEYYNNFLYLAGNVNITAYGPLNGTPSFNQSFWTSTLSKTALANTTYPSINGVPIPNHPMCRHNANNRLYVGDVNASGVGCVHMINMVKGIVEGDTNSSVVPSAYDAIDLYTGWYPTTICSYNSSIAIGVIDGVQTGVKQKNAQVVFWSTLASDTGYNLAVELPDPLITALKFVNGILYAFSGSASGGMRISQYVGGRTFQEIAYLDDAYPPFQGAVDYQVNRIIWGSKTSVPAVSASVFAYGSKSRAMSMGVHNILKTTSAGTSPMVTACKYISQNPTAQPVIAWKDTTTGAPLYGIDKPSTTYGSGNIFNTEIFRMGTSFDIKRIRIPIVGGMSANKSFTVQCFSDEGNSSSVRTINNTSNPSAKFVDIYPSTSDTQWCGINNFYLQFKNTGSALCVIGLPILITIENKPQN